MYSVVSKNIINYGNSKQRHLEQDFENRHHSTHRHRYGFRHPSLLRIAFVIQRSKATKDLGNIYVDVLVDVHEILPPFGRLDDKGKNGRLDDKRGKWSSGQQLITQNS